MAISNFKWGWEKIQQNHGVHRARMLSSYITMGTPIIAEQGQGYYNFQTRMLSDVVFF